MKLKKSPNLELLKENLEYVVDENDEVEPAKLVWKKDRGRFFCKGKIAGNLCDFTANAAGFRRMVQYDGVKYLAHRLIFFYHYGFFPETVDHIDGNPLNNRIENLRVATYSENSRNQKKRKNNTTGYKGVSFNKKYKKYTASICLDGKVKALGSFNTPEEAYEIYKEAALKYYKEFARV
jgi:hypothetical protein